MPRRSYLKTAREMKVLLDTVAIYRAATQPDTLSALARKILNDSSSDLYLSLVSAWEMGIKTSIGKLHLPCPIDEFFAQAKRDLLAQQFGLELSHIREVSTLPHHHRDPFDRLLIAQARVESCAVLTSDDQFGAYGLQMLW